MPIRRVPSVAATGAAPGERSRLRQRRRAGVGWWAALAALAAAVGATETESLEIACVPATRTVAIDGLGDEWDLSGGMFICSDVEKLRDRLACWMHVMYDRDNLYVLCRWIDDTPMNNPGSVIGDHGWEGDCLQLRTIVEDGVAGRERTTHVTAWRDVNGRDVIDLAWGKDFKAGALADARTHGARQAFARTADGRGYVQEMALPWALLAGDGYAPSAGGQFTITFEPNFGTDSNYRISMKDCFRAGVRPDRVFAFMASQCWGVGRFAAGPVAPRPLRLADHRELAVRLDHGVPVVDWSPLYRQPKREGFARIALTMPADGYASLNLSDAGGRVVRHLLTADFLAKGEHEIPWDGLTDPDGQRPGDVVAAGDYAWSAIWHRGLGLRLQGWACNSGSAPFDSPRGNWGGDEGDPCCVTSDGQRVLLGWSGAEAGKAVVCTDLTGKVLWRHKRGGFGNAWLLGADGGVVFVYDRQSGDNVIYRLDAEHGDYRPWNGRTDATLDLTPLFAPYAAHAAKAVAKDEESAPRMTGLDAARGKLFVACAAGDIVLRLDAATGAVEQAFAIASPGDVEVGPDGAVYVLSGATSVMRIDGATGAAAVVVDRLAAATALALDASGAIYVGCREPSSQVHVFSASGAALRTIGAAGGRRALGAWQRDGMRAIAGMRVDASGQLWVAEQDARPPRISTWSTADGALVRELFGPTAYGACGGAISPLDPLTMVGNGCEWRLDPATGKATCVAVFWRGEMHTARFGIGPGGRQYLAVGGMWGAFAPVEIFERLADGEWKLRTTLEAGGGADPTLTVWADANDDQQRQDDEVTRSDVHLGGWITGWYMPMTQSMIFYGGRYRLAPTSWTACGAPVYDPAASTRMPAPDDVANRGGMGAQRGCGSEDGGLMLYNGVYAAEHSDFQCFDLATGRLRWTYPNTFVGVHGGHSAPPAAVGLIRAAYDIVGSVKLPDPIGDLFVIPTDKGEWHLLTGEGFYLSSLFQGDVLSMSFPDPVVPGAIMDNAPPGMGGEDFGGSITRAADGQLYLQAGKTAYTALRVVGLDTVSRLGSGAVAVRADDLPVAQRLHDAAAQRAAGARSATIGRRTVAFTGSLTADFGDDAAIAWGSGDATARSAIARDDTTLYLAWEVADPTPWRNGAGEPAMMYTSGDTVDFQVGCDPTADRDRAKPVLGDLRLSIGDFHGTPTAVVYRPVATDRHPRTFYSGIVKDGYEVQSVEVLADAAVKVAVDAAQRRYVVEAAIPLATLGLSPTSGQTLRGDFGVTYGDAEGKDIVLRSYWSNQGTGLVADEVYELMLEPRAWGDLRVR